MTNIGFFIMMFVLLVAGNALYAQDIYGYEYGYDAAGNRELREYKILYYGKKGVPQESKAVTDEHEITIYPNPAKDYLEVKVTNLNKDTRTRIEIADLSGRLIYETENIKETTQIDMSNITNGSYIMRIVINGKSTEWKIIKSD